MECRLRPRTAGAAWVFDELRSFLALETRTAQRVRSVCSGRRAAGRRGYISASRSGTRRRPLDCACLQHFVYIDRGLVYRSLRVAPAVSMSPRCTFHARGVPVAPSHSAIRLHICHVLSTSSTILPHSTLHRMTCQPYPRVESL